MTRRRKLIIAALALVLLLTLTAIRRTGDEKHPAEDGQPGLAGIPASREQILNLQNPKAPILKIDSIEQVNDLKQRLNSHPFVVTIEHNPRDKSHYIQHEVTVKFKIHPSPEEMEKITRDIDGKLKKNLNTICIFKSKSKTTQELIAYFQKRDDVIYAEPNFLYLPNRLPNDLYYRDYQWNLPAIRTERAWEITRGAKEITIAVIDTGVDLKHPDLVHRLTKGFNALKDNGEPQDDHGHGTHVAGIIAAETNNGQGVAGITWYNKIMPIKAMSGEGAGSAFDIAQGIIWAVDHGADVINMSLGNYHPSTLLEEAVQYAFKHDVVLIAATGNDNTSQPGYPAAYPEVLGVSAVNWDGKRAEFSNYGDYVDVVAPGVNIASTYPGNRYAALSGTSMAAPHVSALAGLIRSVNPDLKNTEVMEIIKKSTVDLGDPGKDIYYGNGLIDIDKAVETAYYKKYPQARVRDWMNRYILDKK